jgi:uncharacterized BrkB/YihY/UPF0761 family membrane protein
VAENPQEAVRELRELVVAYAKQETIEPIKGLRRYVGFGLAAGLLLGLGAVFFELGLLRVLEDETGDTFTGNWSWVPYVIVIVISIAVAGLVWLARDRRKKK